MTKPDKTLQFALTIEQWNAIDLLVVGKTDQEVAEQIGKTRQTVCNWRRYHPSFQAHLNQRRAAVWGAAADRLRSLLPEALDVIAEGLKGEERLKVALALVKLVGVAIDKIGLQDEEAIIDNEAKEQNQAFFSILGTTVDRKQIRQELLTKALASPD